MMPNVASGACNDYLLISLGCGDASQQNRRRIFDFSLAAQSACVEYQMRAFLPPQRKFGFSRT